MDARNINLGTLLEIYYSNTTLDLYSRTSSSGIGKIRKILDNAEKIIEVNEEEESIDKTVITLFDSIKKSIMEENYDRIVISQDTYFKDVHDRFVEDMVYWSKEGKNDYLERMINILFIYATPIPSFLMLTRHRDFLAFIYRKRDYAIPEKVINPRNKKEKEYSLTYKKVLALLYFDFLEIVGKGNIYFYTPKTSILWEMSRRVVKDGIYAYLKDAKLVGGASGPFRTNNISYKRKGLLNPSSRRLLYAELLGDLEHGVIPLSKS